MALVGYHASHEQHPPERLLALAKRAEALGYGAIMCSDHLAPWTTRQGHSGHAWTWLGAAAASVHVPLGLVTCPIERQHVTTVAQAAATLHRLAPGGAWVALGSGEALNEHVTGRPWPPKEERDARLEEAAHVCRRLWRGEEVTHRGHIVVDRARLWSLPPTPPLLVAAAVSPETARWAAGWADALITVGGERAGLAEVLDAWRAGGGARKPAFLQAKVAYAPDEDEALVGAMDQWRVMCLPGRAFEELATPEEFEAREHLVTEADVRREVRVSADLAWHARELAKDARLGFDRVYVHEVGPAQERTLDAFARDVLPIVQAQSRLVS